MHFCWDIQPRIGPPSLQMQSHPWWSGAVSLGVLATTMRLRRYKMCREPKGWAWFEAGIVVGLVKISDDFRWFQWPFRKNLSKTWFWFIVISDQMAISRYVTSKRRQWVMSFHMTATGVPLGRWCRRNRELAFFCKWNWHLNGSMFWTWDLLRPQSPVLHSFATPG